MTGQLRLGFAIENRWSGGYLSLLARENGIETSVHQFLAYARDHGQIAVQRLGDLSIEPARAALGAIRLQENPRLQNRLGRRLAFGDQCVQPCALLRVQFDNESLSRHDCPALPVDAGLARITVRCGRA